MNYHGLGVDHYLFEQGWTWALSFLLRVFSWPYKRYFYGVKLFSFFISITYFFFCQVLFSTYLSHADLEHFFSFFT